MTYPYDESLAEQHAIDDALEADRDPFAGDDPTDDYLAEEADNKYRLHCEQVHGGGICGCVTSAVPFSESAPF